jgi:predicted GH43/DUF377 family glycosyl hydrolase
MITVESLVILSPTNLDFENNGVINPGIYQDGNTVHILYRAVQEGNNSTICKKMKGPKIVERLKSLISCDFDYEKRVEDREWSKLKKPIT